MTSIIHEPLPIYIMNSAKLKDFLKNLFQYINIISDIY